MVQANPYQSPLTDLIDDALYGRFDKRRCALYYGQYLGRDRQSEIRQGAREMIIRSIRQGQRGYGLKDLALQGASVSLFQEYGGAPECNGANRPNVGIRSWARFNDRTRTPEELGVARYEADPQEAAHLIKRVARTFGACRTGIAGLDRRHVYRFDCDGKEIVFEAVPEPYEAEEKRVIPEKCRYTVVMLVQMSREGIACAPHPVNTLATMLAYRQMNTLVAGVAQFIRGLGYVAIPCGNDTAPSGPFAVEAGLGEQGRADKVVSPEFGVLIRLCKVFTDLPLALDRPRDFGIARFCRDCYRCAEVCPVQAINGDRDPSFEVPGPWANPGHKTWHGNNPLCWAYCESRGGECSLCLHVCPWNKPPGPVHTLVRSLVRRTPRFNRFLVAADKLFGYGRPMDPERWWSQDLPVYGIDTRR